MPNQKSWLKVILLMALVGFIFLIVRGFNIDFSHVTIESFKAKIEELGVWGPVIYIIFYVVRPLVFFPAGVLSASAGLIWGLKGLIYLLIGANISAIVEFFVARYFAREAVAKLIKGRFAHLDRAIERRGFLTVLLVRVIPNVAWDIQNLALGLTPVKFRDYFFATLIGIIPGAFVFVYFGSSLIAFLTNPKYIWKVFLAVGIFILLYLGQRYLKKRQAKLISPNNGLK